MTDKDNKALLEGIWKMAEEAPSVGLCSIPFRVLYDRVAALIEENKVLNEKLKTA